MAGGDRARRAHEGMASVIELAVVGDHKVRGGADDAVQPRGLFRGGLGAWRLIGAVRILRYRQLMRSDCGMTLALAAAVRFAFRRDRGLARWDDDLRW
jgi:hypothetical protein